jgi:SAM-dependent methyltransferase
MRAGTVRRAMFKDHFSAQAAAYATYRPAYPPALFEALAGLAPARRLAWDCGTGSGQAAVALAEWFDHVVATDASAGQIAHATPHARVAYRVARAEASGLAAATADLVTVAQALHWFDTGAFFAEAQRVLVPGGVIAAWTYGDAELDTPALADAYRQFSDEVVGAYWPPERRLVHDGYRSIPFPFEELDGPPFTLEQQWTLDDLAGYVRTWSAVARYRAAHGGDPVGALVQRLAPHGCGPPDSLRRAVRWPFVLRLGRAAAG